MQDILNKLTSFLFPVQRAENLENINFSDKFISVSINKNLTNNISMDRVIQLEDSKSNQTQYVLLNEKNKTLFKVYKKNRLVSSTQNEDNILNQNYINKISELFDFSIKKAIELLNNDSEIKVAEFLLQIKAVKLQPN